MRAFSSRQAISSGKAPMTTDYAASLSTISGDRSSKCLSAHHHLAGKTQNRFPSFNFSSTYYLPLLTYRRVTSAMTCGNAKSGVSFGRISGALQEAGGDKNIKVLEKPPFTCYFASNRRRESRPVSRILYPILGFSPYLLPVRR